MDDSIIISAVLSIKSLGTADTVLSHIHAQIF